jgi:hypothetical protein
MSKMTCPIAVLMLARGRMTNQQRIDKPLTQDEATRFVLESNCKVHVFAGLNRLIDIAIELWWTDRDAAQALWEEIGLHMQSIDGALLGRNTLERYAIARRANTDLIAWTWEEVRKRDLKQAMPIAA